MEIKDLAQRLARDAENVCRELLGSGARVGNEWEHDPGAGKIKVHLQGDKAGIWSHFGGDGSGDLLDLYVKVKGGTLGDALDWARGRFGIERPTFVGPAKRDYRRPEIPAQAKRVTKSAEMESVDWYLRQDRGLSPATLAAFRIVEAPHYVGEKEGQPFNWPGPWICFPFLRHQDGKLILINMKWLRLKRRLDEKTGKLKKVMIQEKDCEPGLFGWQASSPTARSAIICEGEIDAMSGHQYMVDLGRSEVVAVFSVPAGCGRGDKQAWIEHEWDRLERFEDICICFDGDKEGQDKVALEEIVHRIGAHRVRIMKLPRDAGFKDTNAALVGGMSKEDYLQCYLDARPVAPDELRSAADYVDEVVDEFYPLDDQEPGYPLPWPRMGFVRIRRGEVSIWTGLNSHGKTAALNQVSMHLCDHGERVCVGSFENQPRQLLERTTRQVTLQRRPTRDHIRRIHRWYDGRLWIVDRVGTMDPDRLLAVFLYARRRFGCTFFIIDSLMRCGIDADDYNAQKRFVERLVKFAAEEDCHIALVAHSRKKQDATQAPGRMDIKGASEISDLVQVIFSVWRNEKKEMDLADLAGDVAMAEAKKVEKQADLHHKPDASLSCDKQRFGTGEIGRTQLWFDGESASFRDRLTGDTPKFRTVPIDFSDQGII